MKTEEGVLKDKVRAYLKARGAWYNMPVPSGYGRPTLDFIGCYKGRFFAVETKAPGKKLTPRQEATIKEMQACQAFVAWDWDWDCLHLKLHNFFAAVDESVAF